MQFVQFQDLGQMPYRSAWDYQTALHRGLVAHKLANRHLPAGQYPQQHHLLFVEHPPVYTLGKSGDEHNLLITEQELLEKGIEYYPINRGGDITFHGLGQIVGYPILDLEWFFCDVHRYVRNLEEVIIRTVAEYGLEAFRIKEFTGVWVNRQLPLTGVAKLCAIGVHLSRWVTLHGWALNVNTALEYFGYIVPCGIQEDGKSVTSLAQELGHEINLAEIKEKLKNHFAAVFECEIGQSPFLG
jgi:lipoyl(octanoyl) transferase